NSCTSFSNISSLFSIFEVSTYSVHYKTISSKVASVSCFSLLPQLPAINNILPHINTSPYKSDYQQINPPITNSR
ncbi:hypothetical protein, partial [Bacteroides thetaiotaomicron]|uniref:hypothetical protein n=2 Tax=Bacteroides thetaiotaomicron TaxID=818 RepID=UPI001A92B99D